MDSDGAVSGQYFVGGLPTLVIIDAEGVVRAVHTGYAPGIEKTIRSEIEALLDGKEL